MKAFLPRSTRRHLRLCSFAWILSQVSTQMRTSATSSTSTFLGGESPLKRFSSKSPMLLARHDFHVLRVLNILFVCATGARSFEDRQWGEMAPSCSQLRVLPDLEHSLPHFDSLHFHDGLHPGPENGPWNRRFFPQTAPSDEPF